MRKCFSLRRTDLLLFSCVGKTRGGLLPRVTVKRMGGSYWGLGFKLPASDLLPRLVKKKKKLRPIVIFVLCLKRQAKFYLELSQVLSEPFSSVSRTCNFLLTRFCLLSSGPVLADVIYKQNVFFVSFLFSPGSVSPVISPFWAVIV